MSSLTTAFLPTTITTPVHGTATVEGPNPSATGDRIMPIF